MAGSDSPMDIFYDSPEIKSYGVPSPFEVDTTQKKEIKGLTFPSFFEFAIENPEKISQINLNKPQENLIILKEYIFITLQSLFDEYNETIIIQEREMEILSPIIEYFMISNNNIVSGIALPNISYDRGHDYILLVTLYQGLKAIKTDVLDEGRKFRIEEVEFMNKFNFKFRSLILDGVDNALYLFFKSKPAIAFRICYRIESAIESLVNFKNGNSGGLTKTERA